MNLYRCIRAQRWEQQKRRENGTTYGQSFAMEACEMRVKSTFRLIDIVSEVVVHHFKSVIATDLTF